MRRPPALLINTADIELWPGGLLRARSNADARALAQARWVLRRKRDGRFLAVTGHGRLHALAVGDQHFQKKCVERIEAFRNNGCHREPWIEVVFFRKT